MTRTDEHTDTAPPGSIRTPDQRVRVFVSSTLGELATERAAARNAIEQLRLTPVMFELGARPHPPQALYRSYLAQSDVFVGIYWQRYGWVAPHMDISGLEDELRLSDGMPRLIYVKRPAPEMEQGLADMLGRLAGDAGPSYKPFADAEELERLLLDDLSLLLAERFVRVDASASPTSRACNLPAPTSSFVGRRTELEELHRLLERDVVRLITLVGPGGTGKTRLAIEVARAELEQFEHGVCFVGLASERSEDDAFAAIALALEVGGAASDTPLERIERDLAGRAVLLVLDNVEQVVGIGPGLVHLLERCPRVKMLVTSREALRLVAEHVYPVPVLSQPDAAAQDLTLDDVLASEAGRLFVDRVTAVGTSFAPTDRDAADIAAICDRLDGLPLALELAAARIKLLSIAELRQRLDRRLDVLADGARDRPSRQRTMRDAIAWSVELLSDEERLVFLLLSVFAGGRLDDIEATLRRLPAVGDADLVETLGALVDKSLVRVAPGADRRPRFSMLQTVRDYAAEQLAGSEPSAADALNAHARHYAAVANDIHRRLTSADRSELLAVLGDELGNLRAAWHHFVERRDVARLDDLLAPLWGYHESRGDYRAAVALGDDLLDALGHLPASDERLHDELAVRATLARTQLAVLGFTPEAERVMAETLDRFDATPTTHQRFATLRSLAALQLWRSDFERATATSQELMSIAEAERSAAMLLDAHLMSCISDTWPRDLRAAVDDVDRAVAYFEATTSGFVDFRVGPNPGVVANAVSSLLRWSAGAPDASSASMRRALDLAEELDHPYSIAFALHHAALLDLWRSDIASVRAHTDASLRLADAHGYPIWRALAIILDGAAGVEDGPPAAAVASMEDGFALYERLQTPPIFWPALLAIRARAHSLAGDIPGALALVEEARQALGGDHPAAADVAIAHGDVLLAAAEPDVDGARRRFEDAAERAARRYARMTQLEALTRLANLDGDASGGTARQRLRDLYETFTEGFATPQLLAAAAAGIDPP